VRGHPYIDREKKERGEGMWAMREITVHFEIIEVTRYEYVCRYIDGYDFEWENITDKPFYWGFWDNQPDYGFMKNGASTVTYYKLPAEK